MSYRSFKKALGETNLERKCRLLFGTCLLVLISGSFWWYGSETDKIVHDLNRFIGKALVNSAMLEAHNNAFVTNPDDRPLNEQLTDMLRSREFKWRVLYPENAEELNQPMDAFEHNLRREWTDFGANLRAQPNFDAQAIDAAFDAPDNQLGREQPAGDESSYIYYQPVFAKDKCITCHTIRGSGGSLYLPDLKPGDLAAIFRVELDTVDTRYVQARNRSLLITLGIITVFLAMAALYVIIRYIIVKPLAHLRDVADAIRRGDVEQRAVIHTGDEFEELGAAFNRMLRQLLRQADELRNVNGELDTKIDELAQVNMRLFEMNQVKSDFLATVSHELRTPLNSILGFSDLLAKGKSLDDKQKRYAGNIERSGRQLLDMINDILDLAKIESGRMEVRPSEFDIGAVVLTQSDLARPLSERKHIELDCEVAPGLEPIRQDRGKIEQILNNLLSNAIKFTPDGGRIHVSARRDRRGDLRLSVTDTGVGISESEQVAVFEKFRQGSNVLAGGNAMTREYSGSGLGLSIVRELCRLLGGDVTLESELGKGSEFTVILPWSVADQNRIESPLAEELRQLAKSRSDGPLAAVSNTPVNDAANGVF
ncbi:MAG: HAMP domain-containing histidine kinase [Pirellulales bacterium]|nr:HAMP domain-containing histidine kinase [Pirellulales bacterium]